MQLTNYFKEKPSIVAIIVLMFAIDIKAWNMFYVLVRNKEFIGVKVSDKQFSVISIIWGICTAVLTLLIIRALYLAIFSPGWFSQRAF